MLTRLASALFGVVLVGCSCTTSTSVIDRGVGQACEDSGQCRTGLRCVSGLCQPSGAVTEGHSCQLTGECTTGLYCGATRTCETAGHGAAGADCGGDGDCVVGLVCVTEGFSGRCRMAGTHDLGGACTMQADCLAGLACTMTASGTLCESPPARGAPGDGGGLDGGVPALPPPVLGVWNGVTCATDDGPARAYFEVPRHTTADHDFFRLPFPSDVRRTTTGLDLSGFPTPGTALSIDLLGRYVGAAQADLDGFATNFVSYFRFSRPYDGATLGGRFQIVDITPSSPTYAQADGNYGQLTTFGKVSNYICNDWIGIRSGHGAPLRPATTYAVILTTGITDTSGNMFRRDDDFAAMLSSTAPTDAALMHAWDAHAPLRAYLAAHPTLDPATLLNAAVFTTQSADRLPPLLRAAEQSAPLPVLSDATVCNGTAVSPCDDGTELRRCGAPDAAFTEIHGHLSLPIFQRGTAPYEEPTDGGDIALDASGHPMIVRTEQVCVSITVPTAAAPTGGYPVLVAAHGTGGSFTDHIRGGIAHALATATVPGVSIGIDLPEHGSRRGTSTRSPDHLVYNFLNPHAARDVFLQGAADLAGTIRFARDASITNAGVAVPIDATRIVLFGHSQGAQHAALIAGDEPSLAGVVLSEAGGDLTQSLLNKTQPFDIARLVPFALLDANPDGTLRLGDFHPALALFQMFFERVDTTNLARLLAAEPRMGAPGLSVFATYGLGDSYTPEPTLQALAFAGGFPFVRPILTTGFMPTAVDAPLMGNITTGPRTFTFGMRQYTPPPGVDGHFVALQSTQGVADVQAFVEAIFAGQVPPIGD